MPIAVLQNGEIRPLEPLPTEWKEGMRLRVEMVDVDDEAMLPQEPFLTEEICAPCSIPWPEGKPAHAVRVDSPLPTLHDLPSED